MIKRWVFVVVLAGLSLLFTMEKGYTQGSAKPTLPEKWVYDALELLFQEGLVSNYPGDWVKSGNTLSRFEVAYYLKQTIVNNLKLKNPGQEHSAISIETLQKLIAEFRGELADLGIQTADIYGLSPNLITMPDDYQDLDSLLSKDKNSNQEPYYYYGQYYNDLNRKTFVFIPALYLSQGDFTLLEGTTSKINIVYQPSLGKSSSFLVVKGNLPVVGTQPLLGYYLFPIEESKLGSTGGKALALSGMDDSILALLDEVSKIQQVESLWQFSGLLSLEGYVKLDTDFQIRSLIGDINQGLKIGGYLICSENSSNHDFEFNNFGLPFYNPRQVQPSTAADLDTINSKNLQSIQINIQGSVVISPQASLYGGLDFLYRGMNTGLENLWPYGAKASGGVQYHVNDYWTFLTCQSFVNSQLKSGLLSTTSLGVTYNDWVTLWIAYQLLNFDNPVVTGALAFRF
jgi:hypothetical protein